MPVKPNTPQSKRRSETLKPSSTWFVLPSPQPFTLATCRGSADDQHELAIRVPISVRRLPIDVVVTLQPTTVGCGITTYGDSRAKCFRANSQPSRLLSSMPAMAAYGQSEPSALNAPSSTNVRTRHAEPASHRRRPQRHSAHPFGLQERRDGGDCAETADEGIKLLRSRQPDVPLLDVMLPGTTGLELFEAGPKDRRARAGDLHDGRRRERHRDRGDEARARSII